MVSIRQMFSSKKSQALLVLLPDGSMKMYTKRMRVKELLLEFPAFTVALDPAPAPALDEETVLAPGGTYYLNPLDGEPPDFADGAGASGSELPPALPPRSASCDQGGGSGEQKASREAGGVPSRTVSAAAALARVDDAPEGAAAPAEESAAVSTAPAARAKPKEMDSYAEVDDELLAYLDLDDKPAAPPAPPASRHVTKFGQEDAGLFSDAGSSFGGSARGSPAVGGNSPSAAGFGGPVLSGMNALSGSAGGASPMGGGMMARRSMGMEYGGGYQQQYQQQQQFPQQFQQQQYQQSPSRSAAAAGAACYGGILGRTAMMSMNAGSSPSHSATGSASGGNSGTLPLGPQMGVPMAAPPAGTNMMMMGGASAAAAAAAAATAGNMGMGMGMGGGQYRRPGPKMVGVMGGVALESPATHLDRNDSYSSAGSGGGSGTFTVW
ncbi:hypothetical protein CLOM_g23772 [Closterium sp. NIES-68]|nr:hypothetical protein CLOM_g23772 [Closterium sp. NIES-68]GJP70776.1 hypothetical protein CLOP_g1681 [Closterium sp. NIES-67]